LVRRAELSPLLESDGIRGDDVFFLLKFVFQLMNQWYRVNDPEAFNSTQTTVLEREQGMML
jgi:hypothetical protein